MKDADNMNNKSKEIKPFEIGDFCKFLRETIKTYLIDQ